MSAPTKKTVAYAAGALLLAVALYFWLRPAAATGPDPVLVRPTRGEFVVRVVSTGELEAKNSVRVTGPGRLRAARIYSVKIEDIVPEGTVVTQGDFIASLDRSEIAERIRNEELDVEESRTSFVQTQLDTALDLRKARDAVAKAAFAAQRRRLDLDQSAYEAPAVIEQAGLELKAAHMDQEQAELALELALIRARTQMRERAANLADDEADLDFLQSVADEFTIYAPQNGMVIYTREKGRRLGKGATVGTREAVVATLPDLRRMLSRTYVNEVDIRRVRPGQHVEVGLDAFPDRPLTGRVTQVANIGEPHPSSDAKVFEVEIVIDQVDSLLRPAMTTSNAIVVERLPDVLSLPLEALHSQGDSLTFVYLRRGAQLVRRQIRTGQTNANAVVISEGLTADDQVYLSLPPLGDDAPPLEALPAAPALRLGQRASPSSLGSSSPAAAGPTAGR